MGTLRAATFLLTLFAALVAAAAPLRQAPIWEEQNPPGPLPVAPLGAPALAMPGLTPEKVRLGRWLFFDKRLSADATVSCATCHQPARAFSEDRPTPIGIRGHVGTRKAPPISNAAAEDHFFWDGRAHSLIEQAKGPIENPGEMGNTLEGATATVRAIPGYRSAFREAYGDDRLDIDRIAEAIAAYEATLLSGDSSYDRYEAGKEAALSPLAREGEGLFFGEAGCGGCHSGPRLSDGAFHNVGVGWDGNPAKGSFADAGRAAVTHDRKDLGAFKTPTLRDLSRRGPYMHDGSLKTLRDVVEYYRRGGQQNPWLASEMKEVSFGEGQVQALVAFLESLDGTGQANEPPQSFPE
jgi:cytochrome c peroxidase